MCVEYVYSVCNIFQKQETYYWCSCCYHSREKALALFKFSSLEVLLSRETAKVWQFEFPTFLKKVGTRYVWLFVYVYDDFRLLGVGEFKILKG